MQGVADIITTKRTYPHVVILRHYRAGVKGGTFPPRNVLNAALIANFDSGQKRRIGETWVHSRTKNDIHLAVGFRIDPLAKQFAERWPCAEYLPKTQMEPCS